MQLDFNPTPFPATKPKRLGGGRLVVESYTVIPANATVRLETAANTKA